MSYEMDTTIAVPVGTNGFAPSVINAYTYVTPVITYNGRGYVLNDGVHSNSHRYTFANVLRSAGIRPHYIPTIDGVTPGTMIVVDINLSIKREEHAPRYRYILKLKANRHNNAHHHKIIAQRIVSVLELERANPGIRHNILTNLMTMGIRLLRGLPLASDDWSERTPQNRGTMSHLNIRSVYLDEIPNTPPEREEGTIYATNSILIKEGSKTRAIKKEDLTIYDEVVGG